MIWHSASLDEIKTQLKTDSERGLTEQEAAKRLSQVGPNRLQEKGHTTFLQKFAEQLKDFMVIILMIAAVISFLTGLINGEIDLAEPLIIIAIVLVNSLLGVFQESRAEAALDALKNMSAPSAKVLRDGVVRVVPSDTLVPGDVIELEAGDFIPADGRVIVSGALRCDEASLTGESVPSEKMVEVQVPDIAGIGDRTNMVYSGCSVAYGRGRAIVTGTGMDTEMGKIASILDNTEDSVTPLKLKLAELGKMLGFLALGICGIIFIVGIIKALVGGENIIEKAVESLMVAVSLAVAAIPEGLPAIVTIVLSLGVKRMVKKNAIVRRLPAVETLGSASVICSDKTGTLTQNVMTLVEVYDGKQTYTLTDTQTPPETVQSVIKWACMCCDASVEERGGETVRIGDPTETAIVEAADKYCNHKKSETENIYPRMAEIPFDSDRKLMTTVNLIDGKPFAIVKGAPDVLIARCVNANVDEITQANLKMGEAALRVLAVAVKPLAVVPANPTGEELENGLTFVGLVGMIDPPRPEAARAVAICHKAGIATVMITGDHLTTATAIAQRLGILSGDRLAITGAQLEKLSDEELDRDVEKYAVYARVSPADKIRIVQALQKKGHVVAMTGDGVNDAPALKAADIGCAMGITGTDVAKGAAAMVLTDDNFATIVTAAAEGRGIYDNIKKAVHFLISCNLGEIVTVFVSMLLFGQSPLLPIQLLWINLVTDSAPALALGMEPTEKDIMEKPPRKKNESIFSGGVGISAIWQGVMFGALTLIAYVLGGRGAIGDTMAFAVLGFSQIVHAFNVRSHHSLFAAGLHTNPHMLLAAMVSVGLMLLVMLISPVAAVFGLVALTTAQWWTIIGLSLVPFVVCELVKLFTNVLMKKK